MLFTLLIDTGRVVSGIKAILTSLNPPGPEIKNPKTSLKEEPTHSSYSSEANVKSKERLSPCTFTSNSNVVASKVVLSLTVLSKALPGKLLSNSSQFKQVV